MKTHKSIEWVCVCWLWWPTWLNLWFSQRQPGFPGFKIHFQNRARWNGFPPTELSDARSDQEQAPRSRHCYCRFIGPSLPGSVRTHTAGSGCKVARDQPRYNLVWTLSTAHTGCSISCDSVIHENSWSVHHGRLSLAGSGLRFSMFAKSKLETTCERLFKQQSAHD